MLKHSLLSLLAVAFLASVAPVNAQTFPEGPGKDILEKKCSTCHAPSQVTTFGRTAEEWQEVVASMVALGAEVSDEEAKVLVAYLTANWGVKDATPPGDKPADKPEEKPAEKPAEKSVASQAALSPIAPVASHGQASR